MPYLTDRDTRSVLNFAREISEAVEGGGQLVAEILTRCAALLNAETSCFNILELEARRTTVITYPDIPQFTDPARHLGMTMHDHPMMLHWGRNPTALNPIRISDLVSKSQLRQTSTYDAVLRPMGTPNMLGLPLAFSATKGEGYAVKRSGRDFSDHERDLAFALQIVLVILHRRSAGAPHQLPESAAASRGLLTPREAQVLTLAATGITAEAIGRRLVISPSTVRKHLEHIYRKLGTGDRLTAVDRARRAYLIEAR